MGNIVIESGNTEPLTRKRTGLYSLDSALSAGGVLGIPLRSVIMITGKTHVGKSTTGYFLAGVLGNPSGNIGIADFEGIDLEYLKTSVDNTEFTGTIKLIKSIEKGRLRSHSSMTQELVGSLEKNTGVMMLDSVGAFVSDAEAGGDFGEAFMGKRAFVLGQIVRRSIMYLGYIEHPASFIIISHTHSLLSGMGSSTAGGDTIRNLSHIILTLWQKEVVKNSSDEIMGFRVAGSVDKLRYGGKGRKFSFVIIPNYGISKEMTAIYDCSDLGLIERGATIKVDGKSHGYISKFYEYAVSGNKNRFNVFFEKLEEHHEKTVLGDAGLHEETKADQD